MKLSEIPYDLITILGSTATGKTAFAVHLAKRLNAEILSADSRQIYRKMDIGTGKDLSEYVIDGELIPYHLIDIKDTGYEYNVFEYQDDFLEVYNLLHQNNKIPLLCGGSGMYIEAVLRGYELVRVPVNQKLRDELVEKDLDELIKILTKYKKIHNNSNIENHKRVIRAIEIEEYYSRNPKISYDFPKINSLIIGVNFDRNTVRKRITQRLHQRINEGMIDEVQHILDSGVDAEKLIYYGLEYKYITMYLIGKLKYDDMVSKLNIAIHQFSKRQMTWFRRMEKRGFEINWIDGNISLNDKVDAALALIKKAG